MSENGSPKRKFAREEKGETCGSEAALDPALLTECKQETVTERRAIGYCTRLSLFAQGRRRRRSSSAEQRRQVGVRRRANTEYIHVSDAMCV